MRKRTTKLKKFGLHRALALTMAACMSVTLMPVSTYAEGTSVVAGESREGNTDQTNKNVITIEGETEVKEKDTITLTAKLPQDVDIDDNEITWTTDSDILTEQKDSEDEILVIDSSETTDDGDTTKLIQATFIAGEVGVDTKVTVTATVTIDDVEYTGTHEVTVQETTGKLTVEDEGVKSIDEAASLEITAELPEGVTPDKDKTIQWESSDKELLTVTPKTDDSTTATIKAGKVTTDETVKVTAKVTTGGTTYTGEYTVTINDTIGELTIQDEDENKENIAVNETEEITLTAVLPEGVQLEDNDTVEWTSANENVLKEKEDTTVTVDGDGNTSLAATFTAEEVSADTVVKVTATVTKADKATEGKSAAVKKYIGECEVTVENVAPVVTEVKLTGAPTGTVYVGEKVTLTADVTMNKGEYTGAYTWTVGDTVQTDEKGKTFTVPTTEAGEVTVKVAVGEGQNIKESSVCTITVAEKPSVTITATADDTEVGKDGVTVGTDVTLKADLQGVDDETDVTYEWKVENPEDTEVASIKEASTTDTVTVSTKTAGTATVTVTAKSGEKELATETFELTVTKTDESEDKVTLKLQGDNEGNIKVGEKVNLTATLTGYEGNVAYDWKVVEEEEYVTANLAQDETEKNKAELTATTAGKVKVKVTAGEKEADYEVTVEEDEQGTVTVADVKLTGVPDKEVEIGAKVELTANVTMSDESSDYDGAYTWTVNGVKQDSTESTFTVPTTEAGEVKVTVTVGEGEAAKTDSCTFTVKEKAEETATIEKVELTGVPEEEVEIGAKVELTANVTMSKGDYDGAYTWTVNGVKQDSTESTFTVPTTEAGEVKVTVTVGEGEAAKTDTCTITVKETAQTPVPVENVTVTAKDDVKEIEEGSKLLLTAKITPENTDEQTVTWKSSDDAIATVDATGMVTAVKAGKVVITATVGEKEGTYEITVTAKTPGTDKPGTDTDKPGTDEPGTDTDKPGTDEPGTDTDKPSTDKPGTDTDKPGTDKPGTDTEKPGTDKPGIDTEKPGTDKPGTDTEKPGTDKPGTDTEKPGTDTEKPEKVNVTKIALNKKTATVAKGKSFTLKAVVTPENATDKTVTWKSSDSKIATVANGKVTAKKAGTVTITAKAGKKTAKCVVTVSEVTLNVKTMPLQAGKSTTALKAAVSTDKDAVASWKSSNKKVATVSKNGKITAKKAGKATITVTTKKGATASCVVTVQKGKVKLNKLSFVEKKVVVQTNKTVKLEVKKNPISATDKITWTSSNKKVATVDQNGKVKGLKKGTVTITAKAGSKKATITVTVKKPSVTLKKAGATLKVGQTTTIAVKKSFPEKDTVASYKSSNSKIASVSKSGKVTGKKKGTATITVKMKSGATAKFKVIVK